MLELIISIIICSYTLGNPEPFKWSDFYWQWWNTCQSVSQRIKVSFHQIDFQNASSMFANFKPMWVYLNKQNIFHIHPCTVILTLFLSGRPLTGSWRYQVSVWSMSWTNRALFKKASHLNYDPDLTVNEQSYNNSKGSFHFVQASLISILC